MTQVIHSSQQPLVSIVIPCHINTPRDAELLSETLDTVGAQTVTSYEVVVVDDGSRLDVEAIASAHPGTSTKRQHNAGPAAARNTGIAHSRGAYFVFLDADDHLLPPALEAGLEALTSHRECGFAVGAREEMTFEGRPVPWQIPAPPQQEDLYQPLLGFDWYIIPPSSVIFRREVVEAVGGFRDPWGADDLDFYLRVSRRFKAWCHRAPAVTRYRRYSTSSSRDGERMLNSIRVVYERQRVFIKDDPLLEAAYHRGLTRLTEIFLDCVVENMGDRLRAGDLGGARRSAGFLARESPSRWKALRASDSYDALLTPAE
jgi:glycosyltransferase involved in cell wall biosynthesis